MRHSTERDCLWVMQRKTTVHTDEPHAEEQRGRVLDLVPKKIVRFAEDYGVLPFGAKPCPCCGGIHQETITSRIFAAERRVIPTCR